MPSILVCFDALGVNKKVGQITVRLFSASLLAVGAVQHFAVGLHGLDQILQDVALHNRNTSKVELGKASFAD